MIKHALLDFKKCCIKGSYVDVKSKIILSIDAYKIQADAHYKLKGNNIGYYVLLLIHLKCFFLKTPLKSFMLIPLVHFKL